MFAPTQRHRSLAALAHLSAFLGFWQPILSVIGPLVAWLSLRGESSFVEDQAREALNFQLSILVWSLLGGLVAAVLALLTFGLALVVIVPVAIACALLNICLTVAAALNANEGKRYRYPFTMRIVR